MARGSLTEDPHAFQCLMHERLRATLDDYLGVVRDALPPEAL